MRILFLPYDVLSSVTRQVMLARAFAAAGHEVLFAGEGEWLDLAREEGYPVEALPNLATARLLAKLRSFHDRFRDAARLAVELLRELDVSSYVEAEVALLSRLRPAAVLSEERPTIPVSARISGVPHVSLRNAYRTPYTKLAVSDLGLAAARLGMSPVRVEGWVLRLVSVPFLGRFRRILARHGIEERWTYERYLRSDALVLLCDIPEYSPVTGMPANHHFIGPLTWRARSAPPEWVRELPPERSTVYVSLGSSGTPALFGRIVEALAGSSGRPRTLVVTTGRQVAVPELAVGRGFHACDLVDAEPILARSAACVCHGGNGTVYQALKTGTPVVAVPTHIEQRWNARRVEAMGLGAALGIEEVGSRPWRLAEVVEQVANDQGVRARVEAFREKLAGWDAPRAAVGIVERTFPS